MLPVIAPVSSMIPFSYSLWESVTSALPATLLESLPHCGAPTSTTPPAISSPPYDLQVTADLEIPADLESSEHQHLVAGRQRDFIPAHDALRVTPQRLPD